MSKLTIKKAGLNILEIRVIRMVNGDIKSFKKRDDIETKGPSAEMPKNLDKNG